MSAPDSSTPTTAEYARRWRAENPEKAAAAKRRYRVAHRDALSEADRAYREANKEKRVVWLRDWKLANPEKRAAYNRNYRARQSGAPGSHTVADVRAQHVRQHGKCYWCGEKVGSHYHVDHVLPLALGGSDGAENLVISCPACNDAKGAKHPMDFAGRLL